MFHQKYHLLYPLPHQVMRLQFWIEKYQSKHSPLLIVDEKVISKSVPGTTQIKELKDKYMDISVIRTSKRDENHMTPKSLDEGLVEVDTTWGSIQPVQVAPNIKTIGEIEVYHHQINGFPIIDARKPDTTEGRSIPGSKNIPYDELAKRMEELDKVHPSIFYCNGPQCPQSATAIRILLAAGFPADRILYYRGGMHDWMTLGLPVE